MTRSEVVFLS